DVLLFLVGDLDDVGKRWRAGAARSAGTPGVGLPAGDDAVFLRGDLHPSVGRGTTAGDLKFRRTLQHDLDRLAAGFLGELCRGDPQGIIAEFAAEAATDMLLLNAHVCRGNLEGGSDLLADAGDVLCRQMKQQTVLVRPFGDAAVSLEAAVRDDWRSIET